MRYHKCQYDRFDVGVVEVLGPDLDELVRVEGRWRGEVGGLTGQDGDLHARGSTRGLDFHRHCADRYGRLSKDELRGALFWQLRFLGLELLDFEAVRRVQKGRAVGTPHASNGCESERHKRCKQPPPHATPGDIASDNPINQSTILPVGRYWAAHSALRDRRLGQELVVDRYDVLRYSAFVELVQGL